MFVLLTSNSIVSLIKRNKSRNKKTCEIKKAKIEKNVKLKNKKKFSLQSQMVFNVCVFAAPDIRIIDEARHELRDRYYKTGSGIELACVVQPSCPDSRVPYPVWRKNGKMLPDHVNVYHING